MRERSEESPSENNGDAVRIIELHGTVGDYTVSIEPGQTVDVHLQGYTPLAITGLTVTPWPSEENWSALIAFEQGRASPLLQVSIHQVQKRRVWPMLLFAEHSPLSITAPGLRSPIELRFLWEAFYP
jgi:hypothetical protein